MGMGGLWVFMDVNTCYNIHIYIFMYIYSKYGVGGIVSMAYA